MKDNKLEILLTHINKFQKGEQCQMQIRYFLELIELQHDRHSRIILRGYIYLFEEFCTSLDCPLKKYIHMCDQGEDNTMYLYQHAQVLYQNALSKFPHCAPLRISYSYFLLERLHNKQLASLELNISEKSNPKFDEQFIIFRYKKLIEETSDFSEGSTTNLDVVSSIAYQNHFNQFKQGIQRAAVLYVDFWNLLISPNKNNQEDLTKLNEYGSKINVIVEDINSNFEKMQKLKHNDLESLRLYSEFLSEILNEKEKSSTLKNKSDEIEGTKFKSDDMENINLNNFNTSDENQYIILSSDKVYLLLIKEKFALINKITLGVCMIFGYSKAELLGKHIDILMPEPYHNSHNEILTNKLKDYIKMITYSKKGRTHKIQPKEVFAFGKNKSRYLVPLNFKFSLLPVHDQNSALFIAKIQNEQISNNLDAPKICYLITSHKLVITHISTNAINMLGITQNLITSSTVEIHKIIPELSDENLKEAIFEEGQNNEEYSKYLNKYLLLKYQDAKQVYYKKNDESNSLINKNVRLVSTNSIIKDLNENETIDISLKTDKRTNMIDEKINLKIIDLTLNGKSEGYIFKLETITIEIVKNESQRKIVSERISDHVLEDKIDFNYIPKINNLFNLDPKKGAFRKNSNLNKINKFIENEAKNKLDSLFQREEKRIKRLEKLENMKKKDEDDSSSSSDSSGEDKISNNLNQSRKLAISNSEYYQVNLENIKFQIYHHKVHIIKDSTDQQYKISQVELKKIEENEIREFIYKIKTNIHSPHKGNNEEILSNDSLQIKLIENALTKEEAQPTIVKLKWAAFTLFITLLSLTIVFLTFFLSSLSTIIINVNYIKYNYRIITNFVASAYHVRELILTNNMNYSNFIGTRTDWINTNINYIMLRFNETHHLDDYFQETPLSLTQNHSALIENKKINIESILANKSIIQSNLSVSSVIIEANLALFHISTESSLNYNYYSIDCFFFIKNLQNSILKVLYYQAEIYLEELLVKISSTKQNFLVWIIILSIFCVCSYFLLAHFYEKVGIRKESYLGIFFQIDHQIIKNSLEKCEKFNKKIQSDSNVDYLISYGDQDELLEDEKTEEEDESKKKDKKDKKGSSKKGNNVSPKKNNNVEDKKYSSWESKMVKMKIFIDQLLKIIAFALLYYFYNAFLQNFNYYNQILNQICIEESFLLNTLNLQRELYAGDIKTLLKLDTKSVLETRLNNAYSDKESFDNITLTYKNYLPSDYIIVYDNITNNNLCFICNNNFTALGLVCSNFIQNSTSYGMNEVLSAYIQEMRESFVDYLNTTNKINNSYIINLFNSIHQSNLAIQTIFIIRPAFEILIGSLYTSIVNSVSNIKMIYLASFIVIITAILINYLFIWKPFEDNLNQTIHKTKKMLLIIPKEILAGLNNINKLLEIGTSDKKKNAKEIIVEVPN